MWGWGGEDGHQTLTLLFKQLCTQQWPRTPTTMLDRAGIHKHSHHAPSIDTTARTGIAATITHETNTTSSWLCQSTKGTATCTTIGEYRKLSMALCTYPAIFMHPANESEATTIRLASNPQTRKQLRVTGAATQPYMKCTNTRWPQAHAQLYVVNLQSRYG